MTSNYALQKYNQQNTYAMNEQQLRRYAPSIFAEHASDGRGAGYKFYSTYALLQELFGRGWEAFQANESMVRDEKNQGFQKHLIRLRHSGASDMAAVGDTQFNIVLINSHDGKSSYQLHAALFRKVCSNGLIVSDKTFEPIRLRHSSLTQDDVIDATVTIIDEIPRIGDTVKQFQTIKLAEPERVEFARAALQLRWDNDDNGKTSAPIKAEQLLSPIRYGDRQPDLYTTYNVVQENLIRGGVPGLTRNGQRTSTRAVASVDANVKLNKALWALTEGMANLKATAVI